MFHLILCIGNSEIYFCYSIWHKVCNLNTIEEEQRELARQIVRIPVPITKERKNKEKFIIQCNTSQKMSFNYIISNFCLNCIQDYILPTY